MFAELNMLWGLRVVDFERLNPLMLQTRVRGFMMPAHLHTPEFIPHREAERGAVSPPHYSWRNREVQPCSWTTEPVRGMLSDSSLASLSLVSQTELPPISILQVVRCKVFPKPRLPSEAQEGHFHDALRAVQEGGGALHISRPQGTAVEICLLGPCE